MSAMSSPALASPSNPRIRSVARLRDRRERESTGLTLVDGARELRRALDAGVEVVEAFVCEPLLAGEDARAALDLLAAARVPVTTTTETAFAKLAFGDRAEGLVAVVRAPSLRLADLTLPDDPLVVVIEGVEKPGNVGAVLRSADGAGADARHRRVAADGPANPNAIRASAGTDLRGAAGGRADRRGRGMAARARPPDRRDPGRRRAPLHRRRPHRPDRPRRSAARRTA